MPRGRAPRFTEAQRAKNAEITPADLVAAQRRWLRYASPAYKNLLLAAEPLPADEEE